MSRLWGSADLTLRDRWLRLMGVVIGALVVGTLVGWVVGLGGASMCTDEGFGCLGWLIWGLFLGILIALVLFVWGCRRVGLGWGHVGLCLVGWVVLMAGAAALESDLANVVGGVLAVAWPLVALLPSPRTSPGGSEA